MSKPSLKPLIQLLKHLTQEDEDPADLAEHLQETLSKSLRDTFTWDFLLSKMTPLRKVGEMTHVSDGRTGPDIWYTIEYPESVTLQYKVKVDMVGRFQKAWAQPLVQSYLRKEARGGFPLERMAGFPQALNTFFEGVFAQLEWRRGRGTYLSYDTQEPILDWLVSTHNYSEEVTSYDRDGELLPESPDPQLKWAMEAMEDVQVHAQTLDDRTLITFTLPIRIKLSVSVPGDYDYGRHRY